MISTFLMESKAAESMITIYHMLLICNSPPAERYKVKNLKLLPSFAKKRAIFGALECIDQRFYQIHQLVRYLFTGNYYEPYISCNKSLFM